MKQLVKIAGGALAIYIAIVMLIAVGPAFDLSNTPPGPGVEPLTPLQAKGRDVYAANGCAYCHTQQVRPIPADANLGRPSAPGDFAYQTPELLGSERTGPDLSNVGNTKPSDVWQYIHLYDPRAVEPDSIMPNFKFLFSVVDELPKGDTAVPIPAQYAPSHGRVVPTPKAKALVAYLLSLKQTPIPGYKMNGGMGGAPSAKPGAAPTSKTTSTAGYSYDADKGKTLFTGHCAACHQATGTGIPGAFPPLKGNPAVDDNDPTLHIDTILHGAHGKTINGVKYSSAMPPFANQLTDVEIANVANHERSSWGNDARLITPDEVASRRAGKPLGATSKGNTTNKTAPKDDHVTAANAYSYDAAKGKALFTGHCAACHQATGTGIPGAFPPLKGNPAVDAADPTLHIETVLHGAHGKTIDGVKYSSAMPPFGGQLSDEDIANVINFERSSWGNHAKPVNPAEVAAIRTQTQ